MASEKKDRQTVFRRIRGRIIPISVGAGSVAAGVAVGSEKLHENLKNKISKSNVKSMVPRHSQAFGGETLESFNRFATRTYKKYWKKMDHANVYDIVPKHEAGGLFTNDALLRGKTTSGKPVGMILMKSRSRFAFLHELGHAEQYADGAKSIRLAQAGKRLRDFDEDKILAMKNIMNWSKPNTFKRKILISKPVEKLSKFVGKQIRATGIASLIPSEVDAWARGIKHLRTPRQKIAMAKASLRPLSTYALFPAQQALRAGLIAGGLSLVGYGLLKKGKK